MKRLIRLTNILLHMPARRVVAAQELTNKFDITHRVVLRDHQSVAGSGCSVIGEAGKGYSLAQGCRIRPVMFTEQEINALLTAQQYLKKGADQRLIDKFGGKVIESFVNGRQWNYSSDWTGNFGSLLLALPGSLLMGL